MGPPSKLRLFLLTFPAVLHDELEKLRQEAQVESFTELTKDMHMYPDLHGKPLSARNSVHPR